MTFAPRTWVVGETVTAALMNQEIRDQINSMLAAWTTYTPTWAGATTNPVVGNGTLVGLYMKVGRTCHYQINLIMGSTTTYGSGTLAFDLPALAANRGATYIGNAHLLQSPTRYGGQFIISPNTTAASPSFPASASPATHALWVQGTPATLASGGAMRITGTYETAT
ncbi:hypothetical protein OG539_32870 [Actinacidiphila glaucinigra]|uniref:hypothetical protein n=1 Tax=Actinacidiphila glaucinigra TaxID=235986 RepID=UPI00324CD090